MAKKRVSVSAPRSPPQTFTNYMRAHLIDPSRVFPGSTMLAQDYTPEEVDLLTNWVLFLRTRSVPAGFMPKDRVRRGVLGEGPAVLSSEETFGAFCTACHGARGQGRSYGTSEARFPAIGSADFLEVASDEFIRLSGAAAEGVRLPSPALLVADRLPADVPERPVVLDYIKAYRERYGQEPATFGGYAYDALMIAVEALKKAGTDREKLRDAIEQTRGWVGTQGVVNMSPTDHKGLDLSAFRMLEIRNGDWTLSPDAKS